MLQQEAEPGKCGAGLPWPKAERHLCIFCSLLWPVLGLSSSVYARAKHNKRPDITFSGCPDLVKTCAKSGQIGRLSLAFRVKIRNTTNPKRHLQLQVVSGLRSC